MCVTFSTVLVKNTLHIPNSLTSDGTNLQVYTEECSKLESVLSTVEQNIKRLLADYDSKKKVSYNN